MRRLLIWVLVGVLILASPATALAFPDTGQSPYKEAIEALSHQGVISGYPDGSYIPDKNVNRAEFAAMITRHLGVSDSSLSSYKNTNFLDMSGYSWASSRIAYCQEKGIIKGDGKGNVMPGRTISYAEAITMLVRTLNMEDELNKELPWPTNYMKLADSKGLTKNVYGVSNAVNRGVAAQLLFNGQNPTSGNQGGSTSGPVDLNVDIKVGAMNLFRIIDGNPVLSSNNSIARNLDESMGISLVLDHKALSQATYKNLTIKVTTINGAVTLAQKDHQVLLEKDKTKTITSLTLDIRNVVKDNYDVDKYKVHLIEDGRILRTITLNLFYDTKKDEDFARSLKVENVKFFGSASATPPDEGKRQYYNDFFGRYKSIGIELDVVNPNPGKNGWYPVTYEYKFPNGSADRWTRDNYFTDKITLSTYLYYSWATGRYPNGSYQVNVYIHDVLIGSSSFTVMSE